jgi:hypothetical protein
MASQPSYPWYFTIEGESLEQGDVLPGFELVVPREASSESVHQIDVDFQIYDLVVMTQSCDIQSRKVDSILLCPWWDFWQFVEAAQKSGKNWGRDICHDRATPDLAQTATTFRTTAARSLFGLTAPPLPRPLSETRSVNPCGLDNCLG